jgi:ABC-2 type transport system permease protein
MNSLADMIWVERRKASAARMPLWTTVGSLFMPLGIAFLIFVARNPEISQTLGLVGAKANLIAYSATDWPAYMGLFGMIVAAGGFFFYVLTISWLFGREFADGTVKDMLAVPVQRAHIILAKFTVMVVWSAMLTTVMIVVGLVTGALMNLPNGSISAIVSGGGRAAVAACLTIVVTMPFALLASAGRGYLLPLAAAVLTVMMMNLAALLGWGDYFPWAIPGLYAQGASLTPTSLAIVILTGLLGIVATYEWWMRADQSR